MSTRLSKALSLIDAAHACDPTTIPSPTVPGTIPYELHYAQKMTSYLHQRLPSGASEPLQLAIRAQHFRRWEVPRSSYPATRPGYHAWRTYLKKRQAELVERICVECGYSDEEAGRVGALIRKEDLAVDEETQALEDVACLVFLDDQFEDFEKGHDEGKTLGILRKTWGKMSEVGKKMALEMKLEGRPAELMRKALEG